MMKKLAIGTIAAISMAVMVSLPLQRVQAAPGGTVNPQGALKPDPFADVPADHWAYNAVEYLRNNGLVEGYPDKTFRGKRPMTRYEFAQVISRMVQGLLARIPEPANLTDLQNRLNAAEQQIKDLQAAPKGDAYSKLEIDQKLRDLEDQLRKDLVTQQQMNEALQNKINGLNLAQYATKADLDKLTALVNEFRNELNRLGVDVDALKKQLKDLTARVEAIEEYLRRMPKWTGDAEVIGKTSWKSTQVASPISGALRPVFDHDARPLKNTTNVLEAASATGTVGAPTETVTPYYDLDLGVSAMPAGDVRVGAVVNIGNYLTSYPGHTYDAAGAAAVTPYKMFVAVPFRFLGSDEVVVGRQGTQFTPYTFKAIDPDTYTYLPREDSGEVIFWGLNTTWRFGGLKLRWAAGVDPLDGRLLALNTSPTFTGFTGGVPTFVNNAAVGDGAIFRPGAAPIATISNFLVGRVSYGEPALNPVRSQELPVGTAVQENVTAATPAAVAPDAAAPTGAAPTGAPAPEVEAAADSGVEFGPFHNIVIGGTWLRAVGRLPHAVEDARADIYSADARFKLGPLELQGEGAWGESATGGFARPRSLRDSALDFRGFWGFGLGSIADLKIGGGWRRVTLGYNTPGYWGLMGSWKNPRGIEGPLAEIRIPLKRDVASFLRNVAFRASAEFYEGTQNVFTPAAPGAVGATDPNETNLKLDRYLAGVSFGLTSRDTVDLGVEQVFRNYVAARATDLPLNLPTMGIGGSPLIGSRIKNTETYINFGVGHNFTPDVAVKLLYQLVDFARFAVDTSNQPANYRGYVAAAQVGVRF